MENKEIGFCILLDFAKAFDTVNHKILLDKLEYYGIRGIAHKWFKSYLTNRKQTVCCHGKLSLMKNITIGIPQGSVIGPILFLLMINDISECLIDCNCNIFADDVVLYNSGVTIDEVNLNLQTNIERVTTWYKQNNLAINVDKTKVMLLKSQSSDNLNVFINNKKIEEVNSFRYVGVEID